LSVLTPFSTEERTILSRLLTRTYDRFLERIAEGRKRSVEELAKAAEGRVMGGERALSHGLIDAVGNLEDALDFARKQGKLPKDAPILEWPEAHDPMQVLASQLGASAAPVFSAEAVAKTLGLDPRASLPETRAVHALARKPGSALAILPFAVHVR
jgi:protease-4